MPKNPEKYIKNLFECIRFFKILMQIINRQIINYKMRLKK